MFLCRDSTVMGQQLLSSTSIMFGVSMAGFGDLDGDGLLDMVLGSPNKNDAALVLLAKDRTARGGQPTSYPAIRVSYPPFSSTIKSAHP